MACYINLLYNGYASREGVLMTVTGWPQPMRIGSVIQSFGITYFMVKELGDIPFTLGKSKSE